MSDELLTPGVKPQQLEGGEATLRLESGKLPELDALKTPDDFLNFAKHQISKDIAALHQSGVFGGEVDISTIETKLHSDVQKIYDLYQQGGELAGQGYKPLDETVTAHDIRHVLLQMALSSAVATQLLLQPEKNNLPQTMQGNREFGIKQWYTQVYTGLLHESGYLNKADEERPCVYNKPNHEDRGSDLADVAVIELGLEEVVDVSELKANILGTKMKGRVPEVFGSLKDNKQNGEAITLADLAHFIDLATYAINPNNIEGIWELYIEELFNGGGKPTEANGWIYHSSREAYVDSKFLVPAQMGEKPRFGNEVACLFELLRSSGQLSDFVTQYDSNMKRLAVFGEIRSASKTFDSVEIEGSIRPTTLLLAARAAGVEEAYEQVAMQYARDESEAVKTHNYMLKNSMEDIRAVFKAIDVIYDEKVLVEKFGQDTQAFADAKKQLLEVTIDERRRKFLSEIIYQEMVQLKLQNIQNMEIKIAPLAWQYEVPTSAYQSDRGESNRGTILDPSLFVEAFVEARNKFLSINPENKQEGVNLILTLRREDGIINAQMIESLAQSNKLTNVKGVELAGSDVNTVSTADISRVLTQISSVAPDLSMRVLIGQRSRGQVSDKDRQHFENIVDYLSGRVGSWITMPDILIGDRDKLTNILASDSGIGFMFSVGDALGWGYTMPEIADFITNFPEKSRLRLVAQNEQANGGLTYQILRLQEAGVSAEILRQLGVRVK